MPRFLELIQGSESWLRHREKCITATDIATIMGVNPYKTAYQLWQEKLGLRDPEKENDAMKRGKSLEPMALEHYCSIKGECYDPAVVIHEYNEWAMASLDGINADNNHICEIKCMGSANHAEAMSGVVKRLYTYQIQWQMYVANVYSADYFAYSEDSNIVMTADRDWETIHLISQM